MRGNRSRDTKPDIAVVDFCTQLDSETESTFARSRVFGEPRTVFTRQRIAIFIDECFWHGCRTHGQAETKSNTAYWTQKFVENRRRDMDTTKSFSQLVGQSFDTGPTKTGRWLHVTWPLQCGDGQRRILDRALGRLPVNCGKTS